MTTTKRRSERQQWNPDLAVLASRLQSAVQDQLFARLSQRGHPDLRRRHAAVLAYLDEDGTRPTELARLSGRHKQVVGQLVDELEQLGYVQRRPDPSDRRAKLIVPTETGLEAIRAADEAVAEVEAGNADAVGRRVYADFRNVLRALVDAAGSRDGRAGRSGPRFT